MWYGLFLAAFGPASTRYTAIGFTHTARFARKTREQKRKVRVHVPSLAVLNVCVGAIAARALRTALAHGIHRVRSGAFLHCVLLVFREHTFVSRL